MRPVKTFRVPCARRCAHAWRVRGRMSLIKSRARNRFFYKKKAALFCWHGREQTLCWGVAKRFNQFRACGKHGHSQDAKRTCSFGILLERYACSFSFGIIFVNAPTLNDEDRRFALFLSRNSSESTL